MKTKQCQSGSLFDLIVAADNLNAFMKLMFYLNKISLSGMVPETSTRGAFHIKASGLGIKNKENNIKPESINSINSTMTTQESDQIDEKVKDEDNIKENNNVDEIKHEVISQQENIKPETGVDHIQINSSNKISDKKPKKVAHIEPDINDLSLSKLPTLNLKQPKKEEKEEISFIEQMRRLDEIKQEKIASLMDKNINKNMNMNDEELMELKRDLQPIGISKLKSFNSDNLNPIDKQKNKIDEIRNLINLNKKKNVDEESKIKSEDKHKEEELERRRNHFNQIKTKLKTNLINFSNLDGKEDGKE